MEHSTHDDKGVGILWTILSWIATGASFVVDHYQIVTVPLSIAVSIFAIIYYRTATKAIKTKNNGQSEH